MKPIQATLSEQRERIIGVAARHGAYNIRLFGSIANGEDREDSDIDLLVDAEGPTSSWFPAGLMLDLEKLLGRRVDIVTAKALHPELRSQILKEAKPL